MPRTRRRKGEPTPPSRRTWDKVKMVEAVKKVRSYEMGVKKAVKIVEMPMTTLRRFARQVETSPAIWLSKNFGERRRTCFWRTRANKSAAGEVAEEGHRMLRERRKSNQIAQTLTIQLPT
ncbi:hypothetical protein PR048_009835 [Dryococelus australis]|uniref:HTH psq-type domain-containing protein n=1 Tax=Dryococelus australis TaxID=614101 RepID=A0ABQ9I105_9NEOP|nr:hypothetical protein PR048_009835 [Dryococelus australis]